MIVPLALMKHCVRKYDASYLHDQVYLNPTPLELRLRNHPEANSRENPT